MGSTPSINTRLWLLPLILAVLANSNVLSNQFVWDDMIFLKEQLPGFQNLYDVFFPNLKIYQLSKDYYRPMIILSYLWDRGLWNGNPFGYHLTVFLFHVGNTLLVFFLSLHLLRDHPKGPQASALSSSIFAVHPIHTENVAWMAGRSDIIPAFLMFLAMLCYAKYRAKEGCGLAGPSPGSGNIKGSDQALLGDATGSGGPPTARLPDGQGEAGFGEVTEPDRPPDKIGTERTETHIGGAGRFYFLFLSSLSLFLALLSKEVAISLLALLPLYDHLAQRTALVKGTEPPKVRFILYLLPLLAFLSYFMMRRAALGSSTGSTHWRDRGDENLFLDSLSIVGFYLKKLLWPFDLQAFIPEIPNSNSHLFLSLLLLFSSVLLFAWAYWKHRPVIAFSIAWVFVTLSPSILVAFTTVSKTPLAERYLYIPSFGFTLITGLLLMNLLESPPLQKGILRSLKPAIGLLLIGTILGTGAWTTLNRNRVWNNSIAFWSDLIQKTPEYGLPHNNLGNAYMVTGRMDEAMEEFKLALQLKYEKFGKSMASTALGAVFMFRGEYDQAEQAFLSAIRLKQTNYYPYYYLGILYIDRTDTMTNHGEQRNETLQKAVVNLKKSIELNPFFPAAYYDLGRAYRRLGDEGEAIKHLKRVLEMTTDPSSEIVLKAKRLLSSLTESKPSP